MAPLIVRRAGRADVAALADLQDIEPDRLAAFAGRVARLLLWPPEAP